MSVMCVISITVTVVESFFSNYMLNKYGLTETQSGWAMTVAGLFYTIATFASGFIGTRNQVQYLILNNTTRPSELRGNFGGFMYYYF